MIGKILSIKGIIGLIRAEDGKRYPFHIHDLNNAQNKTPDELIGSTVDFEIIPDSRGRGVKR